MDLKKFWGCIKKSYRKLSFYEFITIVFFAFVISGIIVGDVLALDNVTMKYQVPIVSGESPQTLPLYINMVYKWLMGAGLVLVGIMVTIGGFMYVSSGGDSKSIGTGKKYIINALIGMLLLSSAYLILNTINPDATEMEDIVVKPVEGEELQTQIEVPFGCECYRDTDCINGATSAYFCDWSYGGSLVYDANRKSKLQKVLDPYAEYIIEATIFIAVAFGTAGTGLVPLVASKLATAGRAAVTVGRIVGRVVWGAAKITFKWVVVPLTSVVVGAAIANPVLVFMLVLMMAGGASFDMNSTFVKKCNKPSGDVKGVCLPNSFRYGRLKPHGSGLTDVDMLTGKTNQNGIFSIYNFDGTLPKRGYYFREETPFALAVSDQDANKLSSESIEHYYQHGYTKGIANTDGCASNKDRYATTYCPCIEWEEGFTFIKCKREATCANLKLNDIKIIKVSVGTYSNTGVPLKNSQICLTGTEGELCQTNDDCGKGLECVNLEELGRSVAGSDWKKFAVRYSIFRRSVRTSATDVGDMGTLVDPWNRDKVCMYSKNADKASLILSMQKPAGGITDIGELSCMSGLEKMVNGYEFPCSRGTIKLDYCSMPTDKFHDYLKTGKAVKMSESLYDEALKGLSGNGAITQSYETFDSYYDMNVLSASERSYKLVDRCNYLSTHESLNCMTGGGNFEGPTNVRTMNVCTSKALDSYNRNYIRKNANNMDNYKRVAPEEYDYYRFVFNYDNDEFVSFCKGIDVNCPCDLQGLKSMSLVIPEVANGPIKQSLCLKQNKGFLNYAFFAFLVQPAGP
jgi:hypothetical protein